VRRIWRLCAQRLYNSIEIDRIGPQVIKEAVLATTGGVQQPWESNGLARRVYLTGIANEPPQPVKTPVASKEVPRKDPVRDQHDPVGLAQLVKIPGGVFYKGIARGWSLTTSDALIGRNIDYSGGGKLGPITAVILNGTKERVGVVVVIDGKEIGIRLSALKVTSRHITLNVGRDVVLTVVATAPFDRCARDQSGCQQYGQ